MAEGRNARAHGCKPADAPQESGSFPPELPGDPIACWSASPQLVILDRVAVGRGAHDQDKPLCATPRPATWIWPGKDVCSLHERGNKNGQNFPAQLSADPARPRTSDFGTIAKPVCRMCRGMAADETIQTARQISCFAQRCGGRTRARHGVSTDWPGACWF